LVIKSSQDFFLRFVDIGRNDINAPAILSTSQQITQEWIAVDTKGIAGTPASKKGEH